MKNKSLPSKILLFGEYTLMEGSMALAMPYKLFEGHLEIASRDRSIKDSELEAFHFYLNKNRQNPLLKGIDLDALGFDIQQGLEFVSNIPQGFGVGSSGALVASVFKRYADSTFQNYPLLSLKNVFSLMESHFHGESSGFDPLVSYYSCPILLKDSKQIFQIQNPFIDKGEGAVFLINTGRARKTEHLVNLFLEKMKDEKFARIIREDLRMSCNHAITGLLEQNQKTFHEHFVKISEYQLEYFGPMVPNLFREVWERGLKSKDYFFKLCGAGGGGFLIGFAPNWDKAREDLNSYQLRMLFKI